MQIPQWPIAGERERELLDEVLRSKLWGGYHPIVAQFEQQFAEFQNCRYGITVANGTLSLEMALLCTGIQPGDEVIIPAISFVSTATAVSRVGAIPVFVDIEPYSFNIDPDCIRAAISPKTKAIMPVHFGGPLADIDAILSTANEHNLIVIEDAAHAHGSEWNHRRAGSFGLCASFSFQNGKVMTSGEGGIVVTNDESLAARLRSLANQGRRPGYTYFHHFTLATNMRLSALQAAVLTAQLERLPQQIATRTRNAQILLNALAEIEEIRWQQIPPQVNANSWYLVLGRIPTRNQFHQALSEAGIPCSPFYPHTLQQNPVFQTVPCRITPCPNAEACVQDAFWLPHTVLLGDEETTHEIAAQIRHAAKEAIHA